MVVKAQVATAAWACQAVAWDTFQAVELVVGTSSFMVDIKQVDFTLKHHQQIAVTSVDITLAPHQQIEVAMVAEEFPYQFVPIVSS